MKKLFLLLFLGISSIAMFAQTDWEAKREKFDPAKDPFKDLENVIVKAQKENKRIILDVGGEWCIWCHRLDIFILSNEDLKKYLDENYITLKIHWSKEQPNEKFLAQYPKIPGFPHMFVLEKDGKLLHSQDTGLLEKEKSYDKEKIMEFLVKWKAAKS
jgi:thiol:disulfide interchange protein